MEFHQGTLLLITFLLLVPLFESLRPDYEFHPQDDFCDSDFVVMASPTKISKTAIGTIYDVDILRRFREYGNSTQILDEGKLYSIDGPCAVDLELDRSYLLSGILAFPENTPQISSCGGFADPWDTLSLYRILGVTVFYNQGCSCRLPTADRKGKDRKTNKNCIYELSDDHECFNNYAYCLPNNKGVCNWIKTKPFATCAAKIIT